MLGKNRAQAVGIGAKELANREPQSDVPTDTGQIGNTSRVATMDA
ncbi:MAG: hypothetical protein NVS2B2_38530 [Ktedonobacteraceae bacterium]